MALCNVEKYVSWEMKFLNNLWNGNKYDPQPYAYHVWYFYESHCNLDWTHGPFVPLIFIIILSNTCLIS